MAEDSTQAILKQLRYSSLRELVRDLRDTNEYSVQDRRNTIEDLNKGYNYNLFFMGVGSLVLVGGAMGNVFESIIGINYYIGEALQISGGLGILGTIYNITRIIDHKRKIYKVAEHMRQRKKHGKVDKDLESYTLDKI